MTIYKYIHTDTFRRGLKYNKLKHGKQTNIKLQINS